MIGRSACGLLVLMLLASFLVTLDHLAGPSGKTGWLVQADGQLHISSDDVRAGLICWRSVAALNILVLGAWAYYWRRIWPRHELPTPPPRAPLGMHIFLLAMILCVAAIVRQININQSFWYDELYSLTHFVFRTPLGAWTAYSAPNNHIGYTLLAQLSVDPARITEVSLRIPALIFGLGSVVAGYYLGLQLAGRAIGLLAAAIIALHPWATAVAQEGRGYSAMMALTALSTALLIRVLDLKRNLSWLGVVACNVAVVFIHPFSLFVVWGQQIAAYVATLTRSQPKGVRTRLLMQITAVYLLTNLVVLQLYAFVLPQMRHYLVKDGRLSSNKPALGELIAELLRWVNGTPDGHASLCVPILLMIMMGIAVLFKYRGLAWRGWLLLLPVVLAVAATKIADTFSETRFYSFVLPTGIIAALIGVEAAARLLNTSPSWVRGFMIAAALIWIVWMLPRLIEQSHRPRQPLRDAVELVMRQREPGDRVVALGTGSPELRAYYDRTISLRDVYVLRSLVREGNRIWLIMLYQSTLPSQSMDYVERQFQLVDRLKGTMSDGDVRVYLCESPVAR